MPDELGPDEMGAVWRNQHADAVRMSADELRRKADAFEAKVRRGFRMAVGLLVFLAAGYGSFLYFFSGAVQRIGAGLTLAGFVYGAYELHRRGTARKFPASPASATCAAYRAELERQRDFHLRAWSRLIAFVPGPVVFIMGFVAPERPLGQTIGLAAVLVMAPFIAGVPANRRAARKLQREIDLVNALMRQS